MTRSMLLSKGTIYAKCDKLGLVVEKNKQIALTTTSKLALAKQLPTIKVMLKLFVAVVKPIIAAKVGLSNRLVRLRTVRLVLKDDDSDPSVCSSSAGILEEACKLPEVGFEYICDIDNAKLFRKRK